MEKLNGRLEVVERFGRFGTFQSGTLHTNIGVFKVKDKALEQFNPGTYKGSFLVEDIFIRTQPWKNGTFTELLARIAPDGYLIEAEEALDAPTSNVSDTVEPDPVDVAHTDQTEAPATETPEPPTPKSTPEPSTIEGDDKLFGVLAPAFFQRETPLALDPTVDREVFKAQRQRLKAVGYHFVASEQHWVLTEEV